MQHALSVVFRFRRIDLNAVLADLVVQRDATDAQRSRGGCTIEILGFEHLFNRDLFGLRRLHQRDSRPIFARQVRCGALD